MTRPLGGALLLLSLQVATPARAQDAGVRPDAGPPRTKSRGTPNPPTAGPARRAVDARQVIKPPKLIKGARIQYPPRALKAGIQSDVVLEIDIDAQGRVSKARVIRPAKPTGYGFDDAALQAIGQFVFSPAQVGAKPIAVRVTYRYRFKLAKRRPTPRPRQSPSRTARLVGRLRSRGAGRKIPGAIITCQITSGKRRSLRRTVSNAHGVFVLDKLPIGKWRVRVIAPGYHSLRITETTVRPGTLRVVYRLSPKSNNPYDVMVDEERNRSAVVLRTFDDPLEAVQKSPVISGMQVGAPRGGRSSVRGGGRGGGSGGPPGGVGRRPGGKPGRGGSAPPGGGSLSKGTTLADFSSAAGIIIRGAEPHESKIHMDSMVVPSLYHFGNFRGVLASAFIKTVLFYQSNFPVYYGRATAGVMDLKLSDLKSTSRFILDVNSADTALLMQAPQGPNGAIAVAARYGYMDRVLEAVLRGQPVSLASVPRYYDYQLMASYRPGSGHKLQLLFTASYDENRDLFPGVEGSEDSSLRLQSYRQILRYEWRRGARLVNEAKLSLGFDTLQSDTSKSQMLQLHGRETFTWAASKEAKLIVGVDFLTQILSSQVPQGQTSSTLSTAADSDTSWMSYADQLEIAPAIFASVEWEAAKDLTLSLGARVDYYHRIGDATFDPRLTGKYRVGKSVTVHGGVGIFHQAPTFAETSSTTGNPDLSAERALHAVLGIEIRALKGLYLHATAFYKRQEDLVSTSLALVERDGEIVPQVYNNEGFGDAYGGELFVKYSIRRWLSAWMSYTFCHAERNAALAPNDQTHMVTLFALLRLPRRWKISLRWQLVSGTPTTPILGGVFSSDADQYGPITGGTNSARLPAFHQLDLKIEKWWVFNSWKMSAYLHVLNVYNRSNQAEDLTYSYNFSQTSTRGGLPIYPIVGLRVEH